jgi:hypothetical protein
MISVATSGLPQGIGIRKPKDAVAEIDVNQVPQEPVGLRLTTL